nr:MAG TPA: hypothetical protein [Caudoviricetes sp.]
MTAVALPWVSLRAPTSLSPLDALGYVMGR